MGQRRISARSDSPRYMAKKAQISYFIVIGIIILFGLIFFLFKDFFIRSDVIESPVLPQELEPVKRYVQECISTVAIEGITRLGEQGGYLYFPERIERDRYAYMTPNGYTKVPFWYFQGQNRLPELSDMETDLAHFVTEKLPDCLNDFSAFDERFDIRELTPITTVAKITEANVQYELVYGLEVKRERDRDSYFLKTYSITVPAKVKRVYDLAKNILETENERMFLENITLDLMSMHPDIPLNGLEFSCAERFWHLPKIKEDMQDALSSQIPQIRFRYTSHRPFRANDAEYDVLRSVSVEDVLNGQIPQNVPTDAYSYFHYFIQLDDRDLSDMRVLVDYQPQWGLDIMARPSEGNMLRSSTGEGDKEFLRFLCFQFYHFTYDLRFPVVISVREDTSFQGKGFVMKFATPVQIIHNAPDRRDRGTTLFAPQSAVTGCSSDGEEVEIRAKGTIEGYSNMDLDTVNISYDCLKYRCDLGQTKADRGILRLRTSLPAGCAGGFIVAQKAGYLPARTQLLYPRQDVQLKELKTVNLTAFKHPRDNILLEKSLESWDSVLINLRNEENDYTIYGEILPGQSVQLEFINEEVSYIANIFLYDNVDDLMYGGYMGNITLTRDMLESDALTLHVLEQLPKPFNIQQSAELIGFLESDVGYKEQLGVQG